MNDRTPSIRRQRSGSQRVSLAVPSVRRMDALVVTWRRCARQCEALRRAIPPVLIGLAWLLSMLGIMLAARVIQVPGDWVVVDQPLTDVTLWGVAVSGLCSLGPLVVSDNRCERGHVVTLWILIWTASLIVAAQVGLAEPWQEVRVFDGSPPSVQYLAHGFVWALPMQVGVCVGAHVLIVGWPRQYWSMGLACINVFLLLVAWDGWWSTPPPPFRG